MATAANVNDTVLFERLFLAAFAIMARASTVFADRGYDAENSLAFCRSFGAEPHIRKMDVTRYDRCARTFMFAVCLVSTVLSWINGSDLRLPLHRWTAI